MRAVSKSRPRDRWLVEIVAVIEGKPDQTTKKEGIKRQRPGLDERGICFLVMEAGSPSRSCLKFLVRLWAFCCQKLNVRCSVE